MRTQLGPSRAGRVGGAILVGGLLLLAFLKWRSEGSEPVAGGHARGVSALNDPAQLEVSMRAEPPIWEIGPVSVSASLQVVALDDHGAALEGATIYARHGGIWRDCGRTDRAGELRFESGEAPEIELVGRAVGYTPSRATFALPYPERLPLVFTQGERICGVVRTSRGMPPSNPVRLVAFSSEVETPSIVRRVAFLAEGDPSLLVAVTDEDGTFCIDGVTAREVFSLACGGAGYVARGGVRAVRAGEHVSIEVTRVFGAAAQFVDRVGGQLIRGLGQRTMETWCEEPGASYRGGSESLDIFLAGVDPKWSVVPPDMLLWFFESDSEAQSIGPVRLDHELAGYAAGVERFPAGIVSDELPVFVVAVEDRFTDRAAIEVHFTSKAGSHDQPRIRAPHEGQLELIQQDGTVWQFLVEPDTQGRARVEDVPCGHYEARFVSQPFAFPSLQEAAVPIEVLEGGTRFDVPFDGTGWIRFELSNRTGAPYRGVVQLMLTRGEQPAGPRGRFSGRLAAGRSMRPPFLVEGLEPGRYTARLLFPAFEAGFGTGALTVDVHADEEAVVRARLAP